jgi:pimeloyl-ACP methyl ester carboxylesterase
MNPREEPELERDGASDPASARIWRERGRPFHVAGCLARIHPAHGRVGVMIVGPFGYDDYALHESFRRFAALAAKAGRPCLRFDAPGSGNSADPPAGEDGMTAWLEAARAARSEFIRRAGLAQVIVVGVGMGAPVALDLARETQAAGLALIAPWLDGRRALREYEASSRLMLDALGVGPEPVEAPGDLWTCGFLISAATRAALAARKIGAQELGGLPAVLLAARPAQRDALAALAQAVGRCAEALTLEGFDEAAFDPSAPAMTPDQLAPILAWIEQLAQATPIEPATPALSAWEPTFLEGERFREEALRFGRDGRLFGVLCLPKGQTPRAVMLLLTSGRGRSLGWARAELLEARRLARSGVASLRFDMAGIGDSQADGAREPLYDEARVADVSEAVDEALARGLGPIGLYGRCSGAFLGFVSLALEPRLAGAVICNGQRYVWRQGETVADAMKQSVRSLGALSERVFEARQWRRLLRGEITAREATVKVVGALRKQVERQLIRRGFTLTDEARLAKGVRARFADIARRKAPLRIVIAEGDRAIDELRMFLPTDEDVAALGVVSLSFVPDADHNMTPRAARVHVAREIDALIATIAGPPVRTPQPNGMCAEPRAMMSPAA